MKKNVKNSFISLWNSSLTNLSKLGTQRHLAALRDGFALLVPLLIAASVGVIIITLVFGGLETTSTSILGWISWGIPNQVETSAAGVVQFVNGSVAQQISTIGTAVFNAIWNGVFGFLALFAALTIAYSLARIKGTKDPFIAALVALGGFMIWTYGDINYFGTGGLLLAIMSSMIAIELFTFFEKNAKLQLTMPAGVPPAVGRSFAKLFPTIFTLLIFIGFQAPFLIVAALTTGFGAGPWFSIAKAISVGIQAPFLSLSNSSGGSFGIGFTFLFFSALLWFFGLHGVNIIGGVIFPILIAGLERNKNYIAGLVDSPTVLASGTIEAFVFFGGSGVTLGLVFMGMIFAKRKAEREVFKFGGAASMFNINEPIMFGVPLVLNFIYLVPFMLVQLVLFTTSWLAIEIFRWVPPVIVKIPWTTPVVIGGFLATSSWQGLVLAAANFTIACLLWLPFVFLANKSAKKRGEQLVKIDYHGALVQFKKRLHRSEAKKIKKSS